MKKICKLLVLLSFITLILASCKPDKPIGTPHVARYEIVSTDGTPLHMRVTYVTQTGIGMGQGIETQQDNVVTPWTHEFTSYGDFEFIVYANNKEENMADRKPFVVRLYIDDKLLVEQENDQYYSVDLLYFFND